MSGAQQPAAGQTRRGSGRAGAVLWYLLPALALVAVVAYILGAVVWHANPPVVPVAGVSMRPTLEPGDLVFLKGVDPRRLRKGEIVAFSVPREARAKYSLPAHLVHRIVKVERSPTGLIFQTKGDANPGPDAFVIRSGDIVGRMVARAPGLGYPLLFFHSRQGEIFLGAAALVAILYFLIGLFEERRVYVEGTAFGLQAVLAETDELKRLLERAERSTSPRPPTPGQGWPAPPSPTSWPGGLAGAESAALAQLADEVQASRDQSRESAETLRQLLAAVGEYGEHLRSHTAVMQGLAGTTSELQRAASELSAAVAGQPARPAAQPRPAAREPRQAASATAAPTEQPAPASVRPAPVLRPGGVFLRRQPTMAIDPTELRQPALARSFRGYRPEPVEQLLERAAAALDELAGERKELRARLELVEQELAHYRQLEASMSQALIAAEQNAHELKAQTQREAELLLDEARVHAREIAQEALTERERLLADARGVRALLEAALGTLNDQRLQESTATPAPLEDPSQA